MRNETYHAIDEFGRRRATLKVWKRRKLNEVTDRRDLVREILSVEGEADFGTLKVFARGKVTRYDLAAGLPKGLRWKLAEKVEATA